MIKKNLFPIYLFIILSGVNSCSTKLEQVDLTILCTSDVHGNIFDEDLEQNKPTRNSLANVSQYLKEARAQDSSGIILLDNGDFLQGQPSLYYSNFIDTNNINIAAKVMNYLRYDAATVGNHDLETGHPVYDKVTRELNTPYLSANTIDTKTGQPYFKPYTIIYRKGIKIVVLGMTTPNIPLWLPAHLRSGLQFTDMIECAKYQVAEIRKNEQPDLLVGLFHSGYDYTHAGENENTPKNGNASMLVAKQVDGFDLIILGHDHLERIEEITNNSGNKVLIINPGSHARNLGKVVIHLIRKGNSYQKAYIPELIDLSTILPDTTYLRTFLPELTTVKNYINTEIGEITQTLSGREALFGPSAFTDLIHNAQLTTTKAEISLCSILQMDAHIKQGKITMKDMFNIYSYENSLYTMSFSGIEIDRYLEYSSAIQFNTMTTEADHLLLFKTDSTGNLIRDNFNKYSLANQFYNYSCAAGIKYTVDVSKKAGERVDIISMSDGTLFDTNHIYRVAINSYQGNGGGRYLSEGMGLSQEEISRRILSINFQNVRSHIIEYIKNRKLITPKSRGDWKIIPEKWFIQGKYRDYKLIYPKSIN